ncbi:MAG TPA: L-seryl-tRNA(Sec) selenium transferase [Candidatus Binataceae bacterium]|nr:L-seryl-tRNA(Sec) selenium transferase [Candidatus Binataceae bacterium]
MDSGQSKKTPRGRAAGAHATTQLRTEALRAMPSIDECLRAFAGDAECDRLGHAYVRLMLRRAQAEVRSGLIAQAAHSPAPARARLVDEIVRRARAAIAADEPALRAVVNATGVVLHTNLGRAPLAEPAIEAMAAAARAPVNLEYDLDAGGRGERDSLVEEALCALTGAEAATVVNNNAAAVLLALNSLAAGREVVVSRGELIEIGGSFRLPDLMQHSGAQLREVGTTNRTHPADYERAIGPETALLLKVHPSNYRVVGFTSAVGIAELVEIGRRHAIDVVEDLGSGALIDFARMKLPREPLVAERIAAGAALVTFSGDKLMGGPQAGVAVGTRRLVEKMRANALRRALRCDKLTLAALEATLRIYLRAGDLAAAIPTLRLLSRGVGELELIAERARDILSQRLGDAFNLEVVATTAEIGSGAQPTEEIPSRAIRVTHGALSPEAIAAMFRAARPPVIGRIRDDAFLLDVRAVDDASAFAVLFPPARSRS